jgi:hypothetical protein
MTCSRDYSGSHWVVHRRHDNGWFYNPVRGRCWSARNCGRDPLPRVRDIRCEVTETGVTEFHRGMFGNAAQRVPAESGKRRWMALRFEAAGNGSSKEQVHSIAKAIAASADSPCRNLRSVTVIRTNRKRRRAWRAAALQELAALLSPANRAKRRGVRCTCTALNHEAAPLVVLR